MKNWFRHTLLSLMVSCVFSKTSWAMPPATSYSAKLRVDPLVWQFKTKVQAQGLISQHIEQPRAIYYIINQSYRYNLEGYVAANLVERLKQSGGDPALTIMAAYAVVQADGEASRGLWGGGSPEANTLMASRSVILGLVTPQVARRVSDPALLVMAAVALNEKLGESNGERRPHQAKNWLPVLSLMQRAISLEQGWANARYWHGKLLFAYWSRLRDNDIASPATLLKAKSELLAGAALDPGLKSDCYIQLAFVLEGLKQPKQALSYFSLGQKLRHPGYELYQGQVKRTVDRLQGEINSA